MHAVPRTLHTHVHTTSAGDFGDALDEVFARTVVCVITTECPCCGNMDQNILAGAQRMGR